MYIPMLWVDIALPGPLATIIGYYPNNLLDDPFHVLSISMSLHNSVGLPIDVILTLLEGYVMDICQICVWENTI